MQETDNIIWLCQEKEINALLYFVMLWNAMLNVLEIDKRNDCLGYFERMDV